MKETTAGWIAVAIAAVWGGSFILMQSVTDEIGASPYIFLRFSVGFLILLGLFGRNVLSLSKKEIGMAALLGTVMFFYMLFQFFALESTSGANTAFLSSSSFLMVPFFSAVFLGKKPSLSNALGLLIAATGLIWMTGGLSGGFSSGDLYALISAVLVATHIVLADGAVSSAAGAKRFGKTLGIGTMQMFFAALWAFFAWRAFSPDTLVTPLSSSVLVSVAGTGILCSAFCFTAQLVVQRRLGPSRFVLLLMLEPLFALLYGAVFPVNGTVEQITFGQLGGGFLVLAGMLVSEGVFSGVALGSKKKR